MGPTRGVTALLEQNGNRKNGDPNATLRWTVSARYSIGSHAIALSDLNHRQNILRGTTLRTSRSHRVSTNAECDLLSRWSLV